MKTSDMQMCLCGICGNPGKGWVAALACVLLLVTNGRGAVYTENFANNTGTATSLSTVEWQGFYDASALAYNSNETDITLAPRVSEAAGVNSELGYLYLARTAAPTGGKPVLIWTEESSIANIGAVQNISSISFYLKNNVTTEDIRLALRIGSTWYTTQSVYNNASSSAWLKIDVNPNTASWNYLNVVAGSDLSMGGAATILPYDNVTGVGFFDTSKSNIYRIDQLEITAIPEPQTVVVTLIGILLFGVIYERKLRKVCP